MEVSRREQILLVDDEPQVLVALEDILGKKFSVFKSESAPGALAMIEHEPNIAVVITDQRMPGMKGDEFLCRLGSASRAQRIMVTGFADINAVVRAVNDGRLFAYVTKPWNADVLRHTVERAVEHFRIAEELAYERQLLHDLMNNSPDGIYFKDRELRFTRVNRSFALLMDTGDPHRIIGKGTKELLALGVHVPETEAEELAVLDARPALDIVRRYETGGRARWISETKAPISDERGHVMGLVAIARDVSERVAAEAALRESESRQREQAGILNAILDAMADAVVATASDGRFLLANSQARKLLRSDALDVAPTDWAEGFGLLMLDGKTLLPLSENPLFRAMREGVAGTAEILVRRAVGDVSRVVITATPLEDHQGKLLGGVAVLRDVTEQRLLESELAQSQKMDAIGRLAGGVAHDFNNLLAVIESYGALILEDLPEADPKRSDLGEMLDAARRAAALTRQLLAFSRQSVIQLQILELNDIVQNIQKMLRRIIGEDIELETRLSPTLGRIRADAGQIEQVILNLTVNARDAMPNGGRLTLETHSADIHDDDRPRDGERNSYVVLTVRDNGTGMSPETQKRIFEPFFTTKEVGKGTGLGLATVYGIAKQSGGEIRVHSELGAGTAISIYFPEVAEPATAPEHRAVPSVRVPASGVILVVEDDDAVRNVAVRILRRQGYQVHEARGAREARRICREHPGEIDLLLADVVMPETTGPKLAEELSGLFPHLRVLFMSGYSADAAGFREHLAPGTNYLHKPFSPLLLTEKVALVLREFRPGPPPATADG